MANPKGTLAVKDLHMTYQTPEGPVHAVRGVNFMVPPGEFYTLLGASGCGKTTTLRCVAGLETPSGGHISIGDQVVYSKNENIAEPPNRRPIGMVFQSYAIWPHMDVYGNVAYPLVSGRTKYPRREVRQKVERVLSLVRLDHLAKRPAPLLSGGQQQRVALARALVAEPTVLLLDEPLSNLDAKLRTEMRIEIVELVKSLGVTTLYVTHDQVEALTMSDKVAVMREGIFVEEDEPREIYLHPNSAFTATFLGDTNLLEGKLVDHMAGEGMGLVETNHGRLACTWGDDFDLDSDAFVACRPENVVIHIEDPECPNCMKGRIIALRFTGDQVIYDVDVGGAVVQAKCNPFAPFQHDDEVFVELPPNRCMIIQRDFDARVDVRATDAYEDGRTSSDR